MNTWCRALLQYVASSLSEVQHQGFKYGGVNDALREIGASADIVRDAFFDFQKFLYEETAA